MRSPNLTWMPSLNALRAFDAVARLGSFQAAAEELKVSSPAVQQLVRALEEALGQPLVVTRKRKLQISDAGLRAAPFLQRGFEQLGAGVQAIRTHDTPAKIRLSVEPSFAAMWLLPRLGRFQRLSPDIDVFVDASDRLVDLRRQEADVAIRYRPPRKDDLVSRRLLDDETISVCAPRLLEDLSLQPGTLPSLRLIHFEKNGEITFQPGWNDWLTSANMRIDTPEQGLRYSSYLMVIQSAIAGHGMALASRPLVQDAIDAGLLTDAASRAVKHEFGYDVLTTEAGSERAEVRAFTDWVLKEAASRSGPQDATGLAGSR